MTFAQFVVCSLLGLTIYALGFRRGVVQGIELATPGKPPEKKP